MVRKYLEVDYSLKELENFRDNEGFLDLTKINFSYNKDARELRGNQNRLKYWASFKNEKVLLKGEIKLDEISNYGIYAELIVEEISKFLNIPAASYDLIKIKDDKENIVKGVFSVLMHDENLELISLHDLIGEDNDSEYIDAVDYNFAINKLELSLKKMGYSSSIINKNILDFKKRLAFAILMLETDKHIENYSFVKDINNIYLSPNYDSESSLLLDNDIETIQLLLNDYEALKEATDIANPRIGLYRKKEEGGLESFWKDTLEALIEDDVVYDYCNDILAHEIDMDKIFAKVEKKLKAELPSDVKLLAKYAYLVRLKEFQKIVKGLI